MLAAVERGFRDSFGGGSGRMFFAPGRINLLGAHLDYNGGDVLPMSVDRGVYVMARLCAEPLLRLRSLDQGLQLEIDTEAIGERTLPEWGWGGYPAGVFARFRARTGLGSGVEMFFGGDLPMASGLSSSAAIEIAAALALDALHGTGLERVDLATIGHEAETGFVGLRCGIMDQFASALGRPGQVLWLHCAGPSWEHVPFDPSACEVLVMDTGKPRRLAKTGFNERVAECASAHRILREHVRDLPHLALYGPEDLEASGDRLGPVFFRRARHVVTEMGRVSRGAAALLRHDYESLGAVLDQSHRSTAEDYEVSCPELDAITEEARRCEAVYGARLTGAGFGGCAIALIRPGAEDAVSDRVSRAYRRRFGLEPRFDVLHAGSGPGEV
ncbi:MAG: galactokinase [Planctomycetota bacterium]